MTANDIDNIAENADNLIQILQTIKESRSSQNNAQLIPQQVDAKAYGSEQVKQDHAQILSSERTMFDVPENDGMLSNALSSQKIEDSKAVTLDNPPVIESSYPDDEYTMMS